MSSSRPPASTALKIGSLLGATAALDGAGLADVDVVEQDRITYLGAFADDDVAIYAALAPRQGRIAVAAIPTIDVE